MSMYFVHVAVVYGNMTDSTPLSPLVQHLEGEEKARYLSKLKSLKISDPYLIPKALFSELSTSVRLPDVQYPDICHYFVDTTSYYTKQSMKAYKSLDAFKYFVSGWVNDIVIHSVPNSEVFLVMSKVQRSQQLRETLHKPWVAVMLNGEILHGFCTCMAGVSESCSHIAATCFAVEAASRIKSSTSSTSKECQWLPPSSSKGVDYAQTVDIDFSSPERKRKCSGVVPKQVAKPPQIAEPSASETSDFYAMLDQSQRKPVVLSMIKEYSSQFVPRPVLLDLPKPLTELYDEKFVTASFDEVLATSKTVFKELAISKEQILSIERETRGQAASKTWFLYRAGRVTASLYKAACRTSCDDPSKSLIKRICYPRTYRFSTSATRWGCEHECQARDVYISKSQHVNQEVADCGLFIHPEHSYIGASPDACISCDCCGEGILEIKCPYCHRDDTIADAASVDKGFCLENVDGSLRLKKNHQYYSQVQCQLMVTSRKYCDFVVFTKPDFYIQRILPDSEFVQSIHDVAKFYQTCVLPELISQYYSRKATNITVDAPTSAVPCFCKTVDINKTVIKCSSSDCAIKEFHKQCMGLKNKPSKDWLCPNCRVLSKLTVDAPTSAVPCFCKTVDINKTVIKCSSSDCTIKEFHKQCMGLKNKPSKKWLCPTCRVLSKVNKS